MSLIEISPLRASERARWNELWSAYQRFYGVNLPADVTEHTWQRIHCGRLHGLGARDSTDHLVGIVHFLYHEDSWSMARACYLQDLYVDQAARGSGCGSICGCLRSLKPNCRRLPSPRARCAGKMNTSAS